MMVGVKAVFGQWTVIVGEGDIKGILYDGDTGGDWAMDSIMIHPKFDTVGKLFFFVFFFFFGGKKKKKKKK